MISTQGQRTRAGLWCKIELGSGEQGTVYIRYGELGNALRLGVCVKFLKRGEASQ